MGEEEGGQEDVEEGVPELSEYKIMKTVVNVKHVMDPPRHSTVDSKVERVGETNEGIDNKNNVLGNIVVHKV